MLLGEKIRNERKIAKISQEELSERTGVSLKTVQRWEACERSPRVEQIMQISKALGLKPEYLLRDLKNEENNLLNENENDKTSILFFKSGNNEVKLPDTDSNRELFLRVVKEMLMHNSASSTSVDSSINVTDDRDSIYHGSNIAI